MLATAKNDYDDENTTELLATFAQYGFRKTSMEDIARAAGVSRQSIYKKYGSKEKCHEWTIHSYLSSMYARIFAALSNDELPPLRTLVNVFDILIGEAIEIVSQPHGTEILDDCLKITHAAEEDWPLRLRARLADFLDRHNLVATERAKGTAFALISAGKGLLVEESSREQFLESMSVIIKSVLYPNHLDNYQI